jgi:hypothetical protein
MSVADQLLPEDEDFDAPDWLAATDGSGDYDSPPYHFHFLSWHPSGNLNAGASEYATFPLRAGGPLETSDNATLFIPQPNQPGGSIPVHMTDEVDTELRKMRAMLCREEDVLNYDNISVEAAFHLAVVSGGTVGAITQGTGGSSPTAMARRTLSTVDPSGSTDDENTTLSFSRRANFSGSMIGQDPIDPVPIYNGWLGNGVFLRAGGGQPAVSATSSENEYSVAGVNGYLFVAYPLKNASAIDLYLEVWRMTFGASGSVGVPTLLAKQVVADGFKLIKFREELRLRLEVDTNGGGDVELKAFIGPIAGQDRQVFVASAWTGETITVGPSGDGAVSTTTGVVTDSGAGKIATFADQTFGVLMGRDRIVDVSEWTGTSTALVNVIEGIKRLTVRQVDTDTIVFNDLFQRASLGLAVTGSSVDEVVEGLFTRGTKEMGLWTHDGNAENSFGAAQTAIRRSMIWTDSTTDTSSPNDFVQTYINPD